MCLKYQILISKTAFIVIVMMVNLIGYYNFFLHASVGEFKKSGIG